MSSSADWSDFWAATEDGHVRLPRCADCGRRNWYPSPRCRGCGGSAFTWAAIDGEVVVVLAMTAHRDLAGLGAAPYAVALVEPAGEPGTRIVCRVGVDDLPVAGDRGLLAIVAGVPTFERS